MVRAGWRPKQRFSIASLAMRSARCRPLASALDIPIYADPEVMAHDMIVFAASRTESLRVRADQVLGGEVTIVPLVQGKAKPEFAAVAEEVELRAATEVEEESELLADPRR